MSSSRRLLFALTVVVALVASGLGGWQLQRLFDRQARNRIAKADVLAEATDLNRATLTGSVSYRRATATGSYDHQRQIFLRGRLFRGTPGVQVVTPLLLEGQDTALLVNRGFVPTADAGHPTTELRFEEPGLVTVEGIALSIPSDGDGQPLPTPAGETWRRLDWGPLQDRFPYPIRPYYLIVTVDPDATRDHTLRGTSLPVRVEPPPLDDGPHLSYAVQWFMIAGAALGFGLVFVRRHQPRPVDLDLVS